MIEIDFTPRKYQRGLVDYFVKGGKHAMEVWHRRAGKDRTATFIESMLAFQRVGLYWHALPEFRHARRVIWDNITKDGQKLVDISFPPEVIKRRNDQEMKLELVNGSIWQVVGADNFNSLVGSNPVHVTLSEFALMNPSSREFIRPILAENGGSELIITTPRGFNHAHDLYQYAKRSDLWHCSLLTVDDTGVLSPEILAEERRTMPDELYRQEYYCDFSAANVGSILGRYVEEAEKQGRIRQGIEIDRDAPVYVSSDIGFRDTSAWWFWQPKVGGFSLVDYDEDSGLDADDWIDRLKSKGYRYETIYLPHDAKNKTFTTRHTAEERFRAAFDHVSVIPVSKKQDRINAARLVMPRCEFNADRCSKGLAGLRAWAYRWDEERKTFSREPEHDWASHPSDAFSYGAQVMIELTETTKRDQPKRDPYGLDDDTDDNWKIA